jgi:hypothetical protein
MSICIEFILLENTEVNLDQFLACFLIVMEISILYMLFYTYYYECVGFNLTYWLDIDVSNTFVENIHIYIDKLW